MYAQVGNILAPVLQEFAGVFTGFRSFRGFRRVFAGVFRILQEYVYAQVVNILAPVLHEASELDQGPLKLNQCIYASIL